jgi:LysM repeat protein
MATYTVTSGDTLSAIARRYNTTVAALLEANPKLTTDPKYKNGKVIFSGTKIKLPDTGGGGTTAPQVVSGGNIRLSDTTPIPTQSLTPIMQSLQNIGLGSTTTPTPTQTTTPITQGIQDIRPSTLASGESGAIGAASIAAQLAAIEEEKRRAEEVKAREDRMAQIQKEREDIMRQEAENRAKSNPLYDFTNRPSAPEPDQNYVYYYSWIGGVNTGEWKLYRAPNTPENLAKYSGRAVGGTTQATSSSAVGANTLQNQPTVTPEGNVTPDKSTSVTEPTPTNYTGQIATRSVENGQVVFRLPDGTIVTESGISPDGYFMYTLPDGSVVKSGKKVPSTTAYTNTNTNTNINTDTNTDTNTNTNTTVQYYRNPTTGALILGPDGKPIVIGPGGSASDVFAYMEALRASTEAKERAALANTFSRRQAQTALEKSQRTTGRDIFSEQKKAINELARRGITSAPGLQTAARRAAGAVPLQRRLDALQQYQQAMSATDLMLAEEQAQADEAQRNALVKLTQASNIANRLSGGTE